MEPFKQRIAALETLGRMDVDAVRKYISHRIKVAGGTPDLISDTGWEALSIAFHAGGTPRTINSLCDRSLSVAFERGKSAVDAHDIYEATQRLGLRTDVFHYIISLKSKERKSQEMRAAADQGVAEATAPPDKAPLPKAPSPEEPSSVKEQFDLPISEKTKQRVNAGVNAEISTILDNPRIRVGATSSYEDIANEIKAKYNHKNLKVPATLLIVSMISLVASLLFFCHQTDSMGFMGCMMDLFSF